MSDTTTRQIADPSKPADAGHAPMPAAPDLEKTQGERQAPDPTRYGDWEKNGRCIDF